MAKILKNKKGFSLIEIIFVLVIIGILFALSSGSIPRYVLDNDAQRLQFLLNKAQFKAMKNNTYGKSGWEISDETCIDLTDLNNSKYNEDKHIFKTTMIHSVNIICYDYLGRVYENDLTLANFLTDNITIKLQDEVIKKSQPTSDEINIIITPYTGYSFISKRF